MGSSAALSLRSWIWSLSQVIETGDADSVLEVLQGCVVCVLDASRQMTEEGVVKAAGAPLPCLRTRLNLRLVHASAFRDTKIPIIGSSCCVTLACTSSHLHVPRAKRLVQK
jgi:hypothetical protein